MHYWKLDANVLFNFPSDYKDMTSFRRNTKLNQLLNLLLRCQDILNNYFNKTEFTTYSDWKTIDHMKNFVQWKSRIEKIIEW